MQRDEAVRQVTERRVVLGVLNFMVEYIVVAHPIETGAYLIRFLHENIVTSTEFFTSSYRVHIAVLELNVGVIFKDALHEPFVFSARMNCMQNIREPRIEILKN